MDQKRKDDAMFVSLANSGVGKSLVDYLERVNTFICDGRNWQGEEDRASALLASRIIQEKLIDKLSPKTDTKPNTREFYG